MTKIELIAVLQLIFQATTAIGIVYLCWQMERNNRK